MQLIFTVFIAYISAVTSYQLNLISGINGYAELVQFDSESNAYVVNTDDDRQLLKLDPQKNIVWTADIVYPVEKILINQQQDIYVVETAQETTYIRLIRPGTSTAEELAKLDTDTYVAILDEEGTLIYGDGGNGVKLLKSGETTAVPVGNLENFSVNASAVDKEGNIYLAGYVGTFEDNQLVVVTKESKQGVAPIADKVEGVFDNPSKEIVQDLLVDSSNNLLILIQAYADSGKIVGLNKNNRTTVLTTSKYLDMKGVVLKDRVFVTLMHIDHNLCAISYFTPDLTVVPVSTLQNLEGYKCRVLVYESDEEGNVFIGYLGKANTSPVEYLAKNESSTVGVKFDRDTDANYLKLDDIGTLWVSTQIDGIYTVEKGSFEGEHVQTGRTLKVLGLERNPGTNEVFILTTTGLYFVSN